MSAADGDRAAALRAYLRAWLDGADHVITWYPAEYSQVSADMVTDGRASALLRALDLVARGEAVGLVTAGGGFCCLTCGASAVLSCTCPGDAGPLLDVVVGPAVDRDPFEVTPCPVTGEVGCEERSCELHYMSAPVRLAPIVSAGLLMVDGVQVDEADGVQVDEVDGVAAAACWHVIACAVTEAQRERAARRLETARRCGDVSGVVLALSSLAGPCTRTTDAAGATGGAA